MKENRLPHRKKIKKNMEIRRKTEMQNKSTKNHIPGQRMLRHNISQGNELMKR